MIIKNKNLVHLEKDEIDYKEFIIKKYFKSYNKPKLTKLSRVFKFLPNGLVHKEETGMGATTLELKAKRNSIIVEPIKITASSKAFHHSKPPDKTVLYVGSETRYHNKKSTKYSIEKYINNSKIKYKKIVVVADSLYRLIDIIGEQAYSNYFLLIDEADSFQMDSTFRRSMEECLDIYKKFEPTKRCLLSSTLLDFSDPDLSNEPKTVLKYDESSPRDIKIIILNGSTIYGACIERITNLLAENPKNKVLIAYNSVSGCYDLAEHLAKNEIVAKQDISILCSINSKSKVENYFKELDSDILPTKINFITSAYFTGFDLNESFNLISISENKRRFQSLSDSRLKQIAGRCRIGLKSETIIFDLVPFGTKIKDQNKEELISIAKIELEALKCMQKHFNKNKALAEIYDHVSELVMNSLDNKNARFIRKNNSTNDFEISYLNIDATLETNRSCLELYTDSKALPNKLKSDGHNISYLIAKNDLEIEKQDVEKIDRITKIEKIVTLLRGVQDEFDLDELASKKGFDSLQRSIIDYFSSFYGYIEPNKLLDEISKVSQKRDSRELKRLILGADFAISSQDDLYKMVVNKYFKIGTKYSSKDILTKWNRVFIETSLNKKLDTPTKAVRQLKIHFECQRKNDGTYLIIADNPFKLTILKTKESDTKLSDTED
jgi:Fe-S cluster assembly iron-binding protein IscA